MPRALSFHIGGDEETRSGRASLYGCGSGGWAGASSSFMRCYRPSGQAISPSSVAPSGRDRTHRPIVSVAITQNAALKAVTEAPVGVVIKNGSAAEQLGAVSVQRHAGY